jgi:hypothetical protein
LTSDQAAILAVLGVCIISLHFCTPVQANSLKPASIERGGLKVELRLLNLAKIYNLWACRRPIGFLDICRVSSIPGPIFAEDQVHSAVPNMSKYCYEPVEQIHELVH